MDENKEVITTEEAEVVVTEEAEKTEEKKSHLNVIIAAAVIVVVGICAVLLFGGKLFGKNASDNPASQQEKPVIPANNYNETYVDIYGITLQDMAEKEGLSLKEYIEKYKLPSDMPGDTNSNAVENMIPVGIKAAEMNPFYDSIKQMMGINNNISNFELYKVMNGIPAEVTEDTPFGEAKGLIKVKYIVKDEEDLQIYKKKYGLGDDVTMETLFKDIRDKVDLVEKENFEKQKEMMEMMEESGVELPVPVPKE